MVVGAMVVETTVVGAVVVEAAVVEAAVVEAGKVGAKRAVVVALDVPAAPAAGTVTGEGVVVMPDGGEASSPFEQADARAASEAMATPVKTRRARPLVIDRNVASGVSSQMA